MMLQNYLDTESGWAVSGPHCSNRCMSRLSLLPWSGSHSQNHPRACCPQDGSHSNAYVHPREVGCRLVLRRPVPSSAPGSAAGLHTAQVHKKRLLTQAPHKPVSWVPSLTPSPPQQKGKLRARLDSKPRGGSFWKMPPQALPCLRSGNSDQGRSRLHGCPRAHWSRLSHTGWP